MIEKIIIGVAIATLVGIIALCFVPTGGPSLKKPGISLHSKR